MRLWALAPPAWLCVAEPTTRLPSTANLDAGEADAISLAKERGIADVLMDEYQGRKVAVAEGLFVLPTLAVLERAAELRYLDLTIALEALRNTTYRIKPALIEAALNRDMERRK